VVAMSLGIDISMRLIQRGRNLKAWLYKEIVITLYIVWVQKIAAGTRNNCFTPFGGGQRLCPGIELSRLELSIFLHHLVTTYR